MSTEPRARTRAGRRAVATRAPRDTPRSHGGARSAGDSATPQSVYWRRRATVVLGLLVVVFLLAALIGRVGAGAQLEDEIAGHVVVEPGETLWEVAAATAPEGVDAREHLLQLRELNGLSGSRVEAWTVVLVPAR